MKWQGAPTDLLGSRREGVASRKTRGMPGAVSILNKFHQRGEIVKRALSGFVLLAAPVSGPPRMREGGPMARLTTGGPKEALISWDSPLPPKAAYGIWMWEKLWRECGFTSPW